MMIGPQKFIASALDWFANRPDVHAVALVGSHARGSARPDSDIDVVVVVQDPKTYLNDTSWTSMFGNVARAVVENWGNVTSLRVFYSDGPEVEFGFTTDAWCHLPPDPGTRAVVQAGCVVLFDRAQMLSALVEECRHGAGNSPMD